MHALRLAEYRLGELANALRLCLRSEDPAKVVSYREGEEGSAGLLFSWPVEMTRWLVR